MFLDVKVHPETEIEKKEKCALKKGFSLINIVLQ